MTRGFVGLLLLNACAGRAGNGSNLARSPTQSADAPPQVQPAASSSQDGRAPTMASTAEPRKPKATPPCHEAPGLAPREAFDEPDQGCLVEVGDWEHVLDRAQRHLMFAFGPECSSADLLDCTVDCDDGDLGACVKLVNTRLHDTNVDLSRAVDPIRDACAEADAEACHALGQLALYGLGGMNQNRNEAFVYHSWACQFGQGASCGIVGYMHRNGGDDIEQNVEQGYNLLRRGCQLGSPSACNDYGYSLVTDGWGRPRDPDRAVRLFVFACEHGSAYGCSSLGEAIENGWGTPVDPTWARTFWALQCTHFAHPIACAAVERLEAK